MNMSFSYLNAYMFRIYCVSYELFPYLPFQFSNICLLYRISPYLFHVNTIRARNENPLPLSISFLMMLNKTKKASTFQSRPLFISAISFRLPPASISAAASFRLTLVFHFRFRLSLGLPFHGFHRFLSAF